ncbi:SWI/SNF complex subunit SWI3D-like [Iris pallida]|uniref:SWI/SNF complex subunit SWI3D-like n=1 Tax=Iris pallida TaxID=29817 RepID=A0AAX6EDH7_IRIPA|nr:SWI/SNF complex subunit SWI3D-like [Iris pallida]
MDAPASSPAPPPPSEPPAEAPRRRSGGQKRKSATSSSSTTPAKRLMKERNALNIHSSSPLHNGPVTRARQSPSKFVAAANHPEESAAAAALAEAASCPAAGGWRTEGGAAAGAETEEMAVVADEPFVDPEFDAVRSRGNYVHVVPVPAGFWVGSGWFSWKDIHPIEKHTLGSFFNGKLESRTPEIYLEIRNSIMKKFHTDPQTQVELKDLSEISIGDTEARQEVMEFLAHWGLINFHPFPPSNPELNNLDNGVEVPSSVVEKLYKFEMVHSCPRILAKKVEVSVPAEMPKSLPKSTVAEDLVGPVGPSVEYHCNSCSADCSRKRYHCPKEADFDLCTECYNNGKFGSGMTQADFILMEPAEVLGVSGGSWTDQETLLLLEALEIFGENWNEIAEHVATKSKAHCILHFLQMSIEDPFLAGNDDAGEEVQEEMEPSPAMKETNASGVHETKEADNADGADQPYSSTTDVSMKRDATEIDVSCKNGSSLPIDALKAAFQAIGLTPEQGLPSFAEFGNPVMALAAFLTQLVESYAATTSTRRSLKAMSEESPGIQLATRHCFILEKPPNDMKDPPASASAVTDMDIAVAAKEEDQTNLQMKVMS